MLEDRPLVGVVDVAPRRRTAGRAWAVVASLFVVAVFAWGLGFYALGFYLRELNRREGWSLASLSWVTLLFYAAATLFTFGVSRLLATQGPRRVFATGGALLAAGVLAVAHASTPWQLVLAYLVLAGGWSSLNLYPISSVVLAWFPSSSGPPLALALTGASVGGVVVIPLLDALTDRYGFTTALGLVAAGAATLVVVLALAVITEPGGRAARAAAPDPPRPAWGLARTGRFWVLLGGLAVAFAVQVGFLVHQLSLLADRVDDATAARLVGLTTASALAGRLVFMALSARWSPGALGAGYLLGQVVGLVMVGTQGERTGWLATGCALFGWGVGVLITTPPLLVRSTFPDVDFGAAFPVLNVGLQLAIASGAPLTAAGRDLLGGYPEAAVALAVLDGGAACLLIASGRRTVGRRALGPVVAGGVSDG